MKEDGASVGTFIVIKNMFDIPRWAASDWSSQWEGADKEASAYICCTHLFQRSWPIFLFPPKFSSFLNMTQARTASWRHWSSSRFVFLLKSRLLVWASVRSRDCGIHHFRIVAKNGRFVVLCESSSVWSKDHIVKKNQLKFFSYVCGLPRF